MAKSGVKTEEKLKDIVKQFFGIRSSPPSAAHSRFASKEVVLTHEILKEIGPESPGNNRIKIIKKLSEVLLSKVLEENAVEAIWQSIKDLVESPASNEDKHVALGFLQCIIEGQGQHLGMFRRHFFNVIVNLQDSEDLPFKLSLFKSLTNDGKDLAYFEKETGPFLLKWMPSIINTPHAAEFLTFVVNLIQHNAGHVEESILSGIVRYTCTLSTRKRSETDIRCCLNLLEAVVNPFCVPRDCLPHVITALCRMLTIRSLGEASWEVMRKLLSTYMGHKVIYLMCCMLEDRQQQIDELVLQSAVFYIGMALWGSRKIPSLRHSPSAVLPSFKQVLRTGSHLVAYEVAVTISQLIRKRGRDLTYACWEALFGVLELLFKLSEWHPTDKPTMEELLHTGLTEIENIYHEGFYTGPVHKMFQLIENHYSKRPVCSVASLISYQAELIHPGEENWVTNLHQLLDRYFRQESRTELRIKALDVLSAVLSVRQNIYEENLTESVVLPHLCHLESDPDEAVRKAGAALLLAVAQACRYHVCVLDTIEKVITKPIQTWLHTVDGLNIQQYQNETFIDHADEIVSGLIDLFKAKLFSVPSCCVSTFNLLVNYVFFLYSHPLLVGAAGAIRQKIIECVLLLRFNSSYQVGLADVTTQTGCSRLCFSPYVVCKLYSDVGVSRSPTGSPCASPVASANNMVLLDYSQALLLFDSCLQHEKDWNVWKCFLKCFPKLLQKKTLLFSENWQLIDLLCQRFCNLITNRSLGFPNQLFNCPPTFTISDFHGQIFPVLNALVAYHNCLQKKQQMELINCFKFGLVSKNPQLCMNALRICAFEMPEAMIRFLPEIILSLSKISATLHMGIPVLGFLSAIVRLPKLYVSFTSDQYLSIFAIALPYTNPFKFSHYMVSLAYHVITAWFTHCRIEWRWHFVKYIRKNLSRYVQQEFEDNAKLSHQNQDSSARTRSDSCDDGDKRRKRLRNCPSLQDSQLPIDERAYQFHMELTETCIDMMSRFIHANFAAVPKRSPLMEFLLSGGQSKSWLVGHKLITITTSGGGKVSNLGICEKCVFLYQQASNDEASLSFQNKPRDHRRRHKSAAAFTRSVSQTDTSSLLRSSGSPAVMDGCGSERMHSFDDMSLPFRRCQPQANTSNDNKIYSPYSTVFLPNLCSCWCVGWAEVRIRSPCGSMAWMMRTENNLNPYSSPEDLPLADITVLQIPMKNQNQYFKSLEKIAGSQFGEAEYETLYAQHFSTKQEETPIDDGSDAEDISNKEAYGYINVPSAGDVKKLDATGNSTKSLKGELQNNEKLNNNMRKSTSYPSLLGRTTAAGEDTVEKLDFCRSFDQKKECASGQHERPDLAKVSSSPQPGPVLGTGPGGQILGLQAGRQFSCEDGHGFRQPTPTVSQPPQLLADGEAQHNPDSGSAARWPLEGNTGHAQRSPDHSRLSQELSRAKPLPTSPHASAANAAAQLSDMKKSFELPLAGTAGPRMARRKSVIQMEEKSEESPQLRPRGKTISVSSPSHKPDLRRVGAASSSEDKEEIKGGIDPSFVFLQLYNGALSFSLPDMPLLLPNTQEIQRSKELLDLIPSYETHKIGVIYVGPNQHSEVEILSNLYGSHRYQRFLEGLGKLIQLKDVDSKSVFLGGLDAREKNDGQFTYSWHDQFMQVIFHVATLMPNVKNDKQRCNKKQHIGNDYVTIVYNDSREKYNISTLRSEFNFVNIVIEPLDCETNSISLLTKGNKSASIKEIITADISEALGQESKVISDASLASLTRLIAIHSDLASMVLWRQQHNAKDPFASNWLERLRHIKRLHHRITEELRARADERAGYDEAEGRIAHEDFTDYS